MCNQNIISNKFDLNLSTTLSSYEYDYADYVWLWFTATYFHPSLTFIGKAEAYPSGQCNKNFYGRHIWMFLISYSVLIWYAFPALSNVYE